MFTNKSWIDSVQNAKRQFVANTVFDATLSKHLTNFIDAQAEYTKSAVNAFESAGFGISTYVYSKSQDAVKQYSDFLNKMVPTTTK